MGYDLKITDGTIVDGTGAPRYRGDVGIREGRIVALGKAPDAARRTIDAEGRIVAPGFVDIHTHYDAQILWDSMLSISPWHGVTSVVMGNCGFGIAPTRPQHRNILMRTLERVEGMDYAALAEGLGDWGFESYREYLDVIDARRKAINVASLFGHTPARLYVMGADSMERTATAGEIAQMQDLVADGLKAGAIGFSSSGTTSHVGFEGKPVPSRLAGTDEFRAIAQTMRKADAGMIMIAGGRLPPWDLYEMLAGESGRRLCFVAALSGQVGPGEHRDRLRRAAEFRARGFAIYPQTACHAIKLEFPSGSPYGFSSWHLFSPVITAKSDEEILAIYADMGFRHRFREEVAGRGGNDHHFKGGGGEGAMRRKGWSLTEISWNPQDPSMEGRQLRDVASERGVHPADFYCDLAIANKLKNRVRMPSTNFDENEIEELLNSPEVVLGLSDAGAHLSQLCDANYSTHLLGHWVREKQSLSMEQAIRMLTAWPAEVYGLSDRGCLAVGRPADVVVFDPAAVGGEPMRRVKDLPAGAERLIVPAIGIDAVVVNGVVLPPQGQAMPKESPAPGRLLRHGHA